MKCVIKGDIRNLHMKQNEIVIEGDFGVSDSFHDFNELYAHRIILFICLMRHNLSISWKSRLHSDGSSIEGWFIAGMELPSGMITYHIPEKFWEMLSGVQTLEKSPEWDGHTSDDVIRRLNNWCYTL